jgi:hypothetical protein
MVVSGDADQFGEGLSILSVANWKIGPTSVVL